MELCLDVGGTSITAGCVENAVLLSPPLQFPARAKLALPALLDHFLSIFSETLRPFAAPPRAVRMAFPGPFNYETGVSHMAGLDKFEALYGVSLPESLRAHPSFSLPPETPFFFMNDVTAFALGEAHRLGLRNAARGLYLCIGTGCGSAFLAKGRPVGAEFPGVPENGWVYPLPFRGKTLDDTLSKRGLIALSAEICGEPLEGKALAARSAAGDKLARACLYRFGEHLRDGLLPTLNAFQPECLVLGGQLMKSAPLFLEPLASFCAARSIHLSVCTDTAQSALVGLTR